MIGDYYFIDSLIEKHLDPTFKGGIVLVLTSILDFNKFNEKQEMLIKMEKPLITFPVTIYLRKNSYLTEVINEKLRYFKTAGLIEYWWNASIDKKYLKVWEE